MPRRAARSRSSSAAVLKRVTIYGFLISVALAAVYPFWWMIVASTRRSETILTSPPPFLPGGDLALNYVELVASFPYWRIMSNSVIVGLVHTALTLFLCSLVGYGFAKFDFPGRGPLFAVALATLMIPHVLGVIPMFVLMRNFGWLDTWWPLIIPGAANAFGVFWMRQYISGAVPDELLQAARIDGAGEFRIYWNIVLPVITPALGALAIFTFMTKWNDFLWPLLILKTPENYTLPVALASLQNLYGTQLGVQVLGATLAVLPVMVVFLLASRWFIAGLTAGAVKGGG